MQAKSLLKKHEGFRSHIYLDTLGNRTIGYGLNLENGITEKEASALLKFRKDDAERDCYQLFNNFVLLSNTRKEVLINMCYNLGKLRLARFKKMIAAIHQQDFTRAAVEMLDSRWARQVGKRADELAGLMKRDE